METPIESVAEVVNDIANGEPEPEPVPAGEETPSEPTGDQTYDIDGEKVTLAQLKEWKSGAMMQADYTRKTQEVARVREAAEAKARVLEQLGQQYEAALKRLGGGGKTDDKPGEDDYDVPAGVRKTMKELRSKLDEITGTIQQERQAEQERQTNAFILDNADDEIRAAMKEKKLPDYMFSRVQKYIAGQNPDLYDPISGKMTKESIRAAMRREFTDFFTDLDKWRKENTAATLNNLTKEKPAAGAKPNLRGSKPNGTGDDKKPWSWESAESVAEVMDRVMKGAKPAEY